jgi:O-antigen/teichoic acid export membrane protein
MRKLILGKMRAHSSLTLGFAAQVLQYGSGLLLLPFVLTRLSAAEIGLWYLFLTVQGLAFLADFGFQPTFARAIASAYAGSPELIRKDIVGGTGDANLRLVREVLSVCRRLYLALALVVLVLLLTAGSIYVEQLVEGEPLGNSDLDVVWAALSVATAFQLYFSWNAAFLTGADKIHASYTSQIAARCAFVALGVASLVFGSGLAGLAFANLISILLGRATAALLMRPLLRQLPKAQVSVRDMRPVLRALWPNASRMGVVAIGAFLIMRANMLVVTSFFGLSAAAQYALSFQLLAVVTSVAQLPIQVVYPRMVQLRVQNNIAGLRSLFLKRHAFLLGTFAVGAVVVTLAGQPLLAALGSKVMLLPKPLLFAMGVILLLEANHSACALVITTANEVPFVAPALLSGVGVVLLATAAALAGAGMGGVIAAQGIVQLAYNNWKWPLVVWKELHEQPVRVA